ncbi:MAG: peptidoglycan editing factor PgeF [bacterium]|nr:peptidoglycan editing factor PgeF [Gammaproteobacteria bacterium]HIL96538.1 peptidoglycan editing factor PgeF [Pseudomonadales bacterium]
MAAEQIEFIHPVWPVAGAVSALVTTRSGGCSDEPYTSLNLATHVGDEPGQVRLNRQRLVSALNILHEPVWLNQVHGNRIYDVKSDSFGVLPEADACYTREPGLALAIMVADCLPILLSSTSGKEIAAVHAGWRGLAGGIIRRVVEHFESDSDSMVAWLGPAIGPCHYEVDALVKDEFNTSAAFTNTGKEDRWMMDLRAEASQQLFDAGVKQVFGEALCTFCENKFYSYRRDGRTGRFAALIWLKNRECD